MKLHAFDSRDKSLRIHYDASRDKPEGVRGRMTGKNPPFASAETMDEIVELGYAHLGRNPDGFVYIADGDKRVLDTLMCNRYHDALDRQGKWHFMAWAMLLNCVIAFAATIAFELGAFGMVAFAGFVCAYVLMVKLGLGNEVEAGLACMIMMVLALLVSAGRFPGTLRNKDAEPSDAHGAAVVGGSEVETDLPPPGDP